MRKWFEMTQALPVVGRLAEELCERNGEADRDEIAAAILSDPAGSSIVAQAVEADGSVVPHDVAGNIVDWFGAEFTKQTGPAAPWLSRFTRAREVRRSPYVGTLRKVWVYRFAGSYVPPETLPEEVEEPEVLAEGAVRRVVVNAYERNPRARRRCIGHHGVTCSACGFDFGRVYGAAGAGYIQVHHLRPVSGIGAEYEVDPINDLRPVCANCHAIIHRRRPPYTIEEVRQMRQEAT